MKTRAVLDIRDLPEYAFGHRSIMWWGTLGFIAIEGTVFVLALTSYFYLRSKACSGRSACRRPTCSRASSTA